MNSKPLLGRTVLVTRPNSQGKALCDAIASHGGCPIHVPMIGIRATDDATDDLNPEMLHGFAIVIFVSPNAVSFGLRRLGPARPKLYAKTVIAVGPSTAKRLEDHGFGRVVSPSQEFSSEGVMRLPALQEEHVNGAKVLIIRGSGGREALADGLRRRGATVEYWEVYERFVPRIALGAALDAAAVSIPEIGIVTSLGSLENLCNAIRAEGLNELYSMPLIVISQRIANEVTKCGFTYPPFIIDNPGDVTMMKALNRWAMDTL